MEYIVGYQTTLKIIKESTIHKKIDIKAVNYDFSINLKLDMKITAKRFLLFLLFFLGIGALYGGGLLIIDPSGKLLGTPISMLKTSPFTNFLLPGIILFFVLGVAPCLLTIALIKKYNSNLAERFNCFRDMHWSWSFSIYIAMTLIIWIQVQEVFINSIGWLHGLYILWAILIIFVALLPQVRSNYKN